MEFEARLRDRDKWSIGDACSMAKVLDLLRTKTTFLLIRECFYGTKRFDDFVKRSGVSAPSVSRALDELEAAGIVARVRYQEPGERARHAYELTAAGEDLLPVFLSLVQWGDAHLQGGEGPLSFVDAATGRRVRVLVATEGERSVEHSGEIEIRRH